MLPVDCHTRRKTFTFVQILLHANFSFYKSYSLSPLKMPRL